MCPANATSIDGATPQIRFGEWPGKEIDVVNDLHLLTAKTSLYLINMSEKDFIRKKNKWLPKLKAWFDENRRAHAERTAHARHPPRITATDRAHTEPALLAPRSHPDSDR